MEKLQCGSHPVDILTVAMAGGWCRSYLWKLFLSFTNLPPFLCPLFGQLVSRNGWEGSLSRTWEEVAKLEGQVVSSWPMWKLSPPAGVGFLYWQINFLTKLQEHIPNCAPWFFNPTDKSSASKNHRLYITEGLAGCLLVSKTGLGKEVEKEEKKNFS